ncbi:MAG TPA: TetR/AcrR family transcriptional regulator [Acidobacteriaceae bacterium]|nr:TetR/AcrR family transcriptional regulator [Acidobacteriaceae bacterium]
MKQNAKRSWSRRRKPVQQRSRVTVDAMLDAAVKLLRRGGAAAITTNRIAETAGVSIGSVYQYFPNKHALFVALHERHISIVDAVMRRRLEECAESSLQRLVESLLDGMVEAHAADPELSELLQSEVPHRADGSVEFSIRYHSVFRAALAQRLAPPARKLDFDIHAFLLANLIDALGHALVLRRPRRVSLARAKRACSRAILACLASLSTAVPPPDTP